MILWSIIGNVESTPVSRQNSKCTDCCSFLACMGYDTVSNL